LGWLKLLPNPKIKQPRTELTKPNRNEHQNQNRQPKQMPRGIVATVHLFICSSAHPPLQLLPPEVLHFINGGKWVDFWGQLPKGISKSVWQTNT